MTAVDLDMLRVYWGHHDGMDHADQLTVLAAAMPGISVPDLHAAWDTVAELVDDLNTMDPSDALERLKADGRVGGGHNPSDAWDIVAAELRADITDTYWRIRNRAALTGRGAA